MRGLKSLVVVLGVLLIAGVVTLVGTIAWRASHGTAGRPSGAPFDAALDLPAGAELVAVQAAGDRLVLQLTLPGGRRQLVLVDAGTGARIGTIELRTAP